MEGFKEETLSSEKIYTGRIISVRQDEVKLPNGKIAKREIVEHPGAVAIIAVTQHNEIILIKQFRKPVEEVIYEIPAGLANQGEELEAAARREFLEETGYRAQKIGKVLAAYTSPGYSTEILHYFVAEDLKLEKQNLDADEVVKVEKIKIEECLQKIESGEIKDNKTILGIMIAARNI